MNKFTLALVFVLPGAPALAQVLLPTPPVTLVPKVPATPVAPIAPIAPALPGAQPTPVAPVTPGPIQQPGLYVQVLDGVIALSNPAGAQVFQAGQFGFTPNFSTPPIILPQNPGLQFHPPPIFNSSTGGPTASSGTRSNTVDCIVR